MTSHFAQADEEFIEDKNKKRSRLLDEHFPTMGKNEQLECYEVPELNKALLVHRAELPVLSHGKRVLIFAVCEHSTPTPAVLSTKLIYLNWKCTNGATI